MTTLADLPINIASQKEFIFHRLDFFHWLQWNVGQYPVHFPGTRCASLPYFFNTQVTDVCGCTCWLHLRCRPCQMAPLLSANVTSRKYAKRESLSQCHSDWHTAPDKSNTWQVKTNVVTKCLHLLHPPLLGDEDTKEGKSCLINTEIVWA